MEEVLKGATIYVTMSRDWLQTQDSFLRGTKAKSAVVVKSTRHVTTLSNQFPETILFTDVPQLLFLEELSLESYF